MPSRPCVETLCSGFAVYRGRCERHAPPRERETHRPRRRQGSSEHARVYGTKRWRILRARKLKADPVCEECGDALATEVDHITPLEEGGRPFAWGNLQSLDAQCHGRKTATEVRERAYA